MKFTTLLLFVASASAIQLGQLKKDKKGPNWDKPVGNGAIVKVLFELMDTDKNENISREEVEAFFDGRDQALEAFDAADGDSDGSVTREEMMAYLKEIRPKPSKDEGDEATEE